MKPILVYKPCPPTLCETTSAPGATVAFVADLEAVEIKLGWLHRVRIQGADQQGGPLATILTVLTRARVKIRGRTAVAATMTLVSPLA